MRLLDNLEPKPLFHYFEDITQIPRGSGNTKGVSDYCVRFAEEHGLEYTQDAWNNVIMIRPASKGYENVPAVILQGHLDMVAVKTPDSAKDLAKDPLDLFLDGDYICARDTSLGGDDGSAVALMLALLADPELEAPRIEALFTIDEENGMDGARYIDVSMLQGWRMMNLDGDTEGAFTCGCAGGIHTKVTIPVEREAAESSTDLSAQLCMSIIVTGLLGGHSGSEIDKGHANAIRVLGRVLHRIYGQAPYSLASLSGGGKPNAIPMDGEAKILISSENAAQAREIAAICEKELKKEFQDSDPGISIIVQQSGVGEAGEANGLTSSSTKRVIDYLLLTEDGIASMDRVLPGLVRTSCNLGIAVLEEDCFCGEYQIRSSLQSEGEALLERIKGLADLLGGSAAVIVSYPGWEYRRSSPLREQAVALWKKLTGQEPRIRVIHAGLECGMFADKIPGLDCISLGATQLEIHTVNEKLSISSMQRMWRFLKEYLKETIHTS